MSPLNTAQLAEHLRRLEQRFNGRFHARVIRLDTGEEFRLREKEVLPTASTFKLCVLVELLRQARTGLVDLNSTITWGPEHLRGGDGVLRAMAAPQELTVHNMAVLMMIVSDNVATARMVDLVGPQHVTETMHDLRLNDTDIHEGLPGGDRIAEMQQPVSTPYDLCELITKIYRREILTPEACDEIIRILRANRCNDMLPRFIPVGEDWEKPRNGSPTRRVTANVASKSVSSSLKSSRFPCASSSNRTPPFQTASSAWPITRPFSPWPTPAERSTTQWGTGYRSHTSYKTYGTYNPNTRTAFRQQIFSCASSEISFSSFSFRK